MIHATYHITTPAEVERNKNFLNTNGGSHYIDLPGGKCLLKINATDQGLLDAWESQAECDCLPHPLYEASDRLSESQAQALHDRLFNGNIGKARSARVIDVHKAAKQIMPTMALY